MKYKQDIDLTQIKIIEHVYTVCFWNVLKKSKCKMFSQKCRIKCKNVLKYVRTVNYVELIPTRKNTSSRSHS